MFTRKLAFAALYFGAALTAVTTTAAANIIYTDYPAIFSSSALVTDQAGGPVSYQSVAAPFVPAANYTYTSATLALRDDGGSANNYTISIDSDSSNLPGTALDTVSGVAVSSNSDLTVLASGVLTLVSGTTYWLVAIPAQSSDNAVWYASSAAAGYPAYQSSSGGPWNTYAASGPLPAFEIDGTPTGNGTTPEPATLALLALGGLILLARRHAWGHRR